MLRSTDIFEETPNLDDWHALYAVINSIKALAPWQWLSETAVFGVQNPETEELGFVSIMGQQGEHYAATIYLGAQGLYRFWEMQEMGSFLEPDFLLNTPQLQASFANRNALHKKDREIIKQLGLKYRGKQAWPLFQSYAPGLAPWFLTSAEIRFLTIVLTQTIDVASRVRETPNLLASGADTDYLVRVFAPQTNGRVWQDTWQKIPPPEPKSYRIPMDPHALAHLHEAPQTMTIIDVDFFWMPTPVGDKGQRPYYPYSLLIMEPSTAMILGHDLLVADPTPEDMWASIPMKLVQSLAQISLKPKTIRIMSKSLAAFLEPVANEFDMDIKMVDTLPLIENVKTGLIGFMNQ